MSEENKGTQRLGMLFVGVGLALVIGGVWQHKWPSAPAGPQGKPRSHKSRSHKPRAHKPKRHTHRHNKPRIYKPRKNEPGKGPAHRQIQMFQGPLPGMARHPKELASRLAKAFKKLGKKYKPRTHHFWSNKLPRFSNRLLFETSPYLLQHAHNPVNWYPWGKAAFALAQKQGKPVFLSVGYSTCHWCHVMERESFENKKIAAFLNKHYICIKVDREERLDVDGIYMRAIQIFSRGGGGWPMSVWLTPQRQPFFGGTYFPPKDRWGRRGFSSILKIMRDRFKRDPNGVARTARDMASRLRRMAQLPPAPGMPTSKTLAAAAKIYNRRFDPVHGGMRGRPKFPSSLSVSMMLRYARRTRDPKALQIAKLTLTRMANGGMYDHVAGGFHRYSVDSRWLVPHFEKMLYDNALLAVAYLDGYQLTKDPMYARVAKEILRYVSKERTSPQGGFYSATDADSEGHEGKFFVWTPAQIDKALGKKKRSTLWFKRYYNVTKRGNFEGKNILHVTRPMAEVARSFKVPLAQFREAIGEGKQSLFRVRARRIPPLSDEKIITSWNGLMISAFARAALVFEDNSYAQKAAKAARFVLSKMRKPNGRLYRTHMSGRSKFNAYLEDYAFMIAALLDLHEATQELRWFREAVALQSLVQRHYWDRRGGYFRTSQDHEKLLYRPKPRYDGAVPTGNSVHALNLMRLYILTTQEKYRRWAEATFKYFGSRLKRWPIALSEMLLAVDFYYDAPKEIILVKPTADASIQPFLARLKKLFLPNRALVVVTQGAEQKRLGAIFPLVKKKKPLSQKVTAYVCLRRVCELPTTDPKIFEKQIAKITPLSFPRLP